MLGEVEQGLALQNQAEASFREAGDLPGLSCNLVRRATDHRFLGNYHASLADADEALALARGDESLRDVQAEALRARGMSLYQVGQLIDAIEWLCQSLAVYEGLGDPQRVAMLHMELGVAYFSAGRYGEALTHYNQARLLAENRKLDHRPLSSTILESCIT